MENSQRCFERLQAGDADGLRRILDEDPGSAEARDANGVSLLMHSLYRGRRDLADTIADKKKVLDIFEAASLGRFAPLQEIARNPAVVNSRSRDGFTALRSEEHTSELQSLRH